MSNKVLDCTTYLPHGYEVRATNSRKHMQFRKVEKREQRR